MRLAKRFFQMIDLKYEKRSTALNINIGFCSGDDVFYDQVIAKYNFGLYFTPCTCGKHHRKSLPVKGIHDARRWVSKFVHFDVDIYIQLLILFFPYSTCIRTDTIFISTPAHFPQHTC